MNIQTPLGIFEDNHEYVAALNALRAENYNANTIIYVAIMQDTHPLVDTPVSIFKPAEPDWRGIIWHE